MFIHYFGYQRYNIHGQRSKGKFTKSKCAQSGYDDHQSIELISTKTIFLLCLIFIHASRALAQTNFVYEYCDNSKGNYTTNSTYNANLNSIMSSFPPRDNDNDDGFYSSTISFYGQSDEVYVVGLCRGDVESETCHSCLNQSKLLLPKVCPNQKEAIGGFNECMLRYSNKSSLGSMFAHPRFNLWNTRNVSSNYSNVFLQDLRTLLNTLKYQAAAGGPREKFSSGNKTIHGFRTIYALVQCTPDLSQQSCEHCLDQSFGDITNNNEWIGGRVVTPSCNFGYQFFPFNKGQSYSKPPKSYQQSTIRLSSQSSSADNRSKQGKKSSNTRTIIISSVVPSVGVIGIIIVVGILTRMKKTRDTNRVETPLTRDVQVYGCSKCFQFEFSTIRYATNNFSSQNRIDGNMYKGKLQNGQSIAVKRLTANVNHENQCFINVLQINAKLQHRNVVKLLGFGVTGDERFLVYEYVPKNLVNSFVPDQSGGEPIFLDWDMRYKIIKGVSRGLLYLHEGYPLTIVHRDIKPSNILLDEDMNPKISYFDIAMSSESGQSDDISAPICGTFGYIAPEYHLTGRISVKVDVYSFGVLLLEVVCGRRNYNDRLRVPGDELFLVNKARSCWLEGTASTLFDHQRIVNELEFASAMRCIHIGLLCVEEEADSRPTMASVAHMLSCDSVSLPAPSRPNDIRRDSPDTLLVSGRSLSMGFDLTYSSEIESPRAPISGIRVAVLCLNFITKLRRKVYFRRMNV